MRWLRTSGSSAVSCVATKKQSLLRRDYSEPVEIHQFLTVKRVQITGGGRLSAVVPDRALEPLVKKFENFSWGAIVCSLFASSLEFTARGNVAISPLPFVWNIWFFPRFEELSSEVDYKFAWGVSHSAGIGRHQLRPMLRPVWRMQ